MSVVNRLVGVLLLATAIVLVVNQWQATKTENINWDEFALLARTERTLREGSVAGGGRPGLVALALIPFVRNCTSSVQAIGNARRLWLAITVCYLAGLFVLLLQARHDRKSPWHGASLAIALLVLVPVFLRWSLQVRTDQPALMFGLWGGVALLASPRRWLLAPASGILFAAGYLCSQKIVYVGAFVLILFAARIGPTAMVVPLKRRRVLATLAAAAAGFFLTIAGFQAVVSMYYSLPPISTSLDELTSPFAYYRAAWGYRAYSGMLPTLAAHGLLLTLLVPATLVSWSRTSPYKVGLIVAWTTLLLGFAVGLFHAAAFPYFWMTLGIFPAAAIGLAWEPILELFEQRLPRAVIVGISVALLLVFSVPAAIRLHHDTQQIQRESLAFVDRNLPASASGFQAHSALFCRRDPTPFPNFFGGAIAEQFGGPDGPLHAQALVEEFRRRPLTFLIPLSWKAFPNIVEAFWSSHYVLYRHGVMIPGLQLHGVEGQSLNFEVVVPGRYRWTSAQPEHARLSVAGNKVENGTEFDLDRGVHRITFLDTVAIGRLNLAVKESPTPEGEPFYSAAMLHEFDPRNP